MTLPENIGIAGRKAAMPWIIVAAVSFLLGAAVISSARLLSSKEDARQALQESRERQFGATLASSLQRTGIVRAVSGDRVLLRAVDPGNPAAVEEFEFTVAADTLIARRDAILEGGTVVGFRDAKRGALAELLPGSRVYVRMKAARGNLLVATLIVYGDPFPVL